MVGAGRDLWRSSSPTPLLKQVHLEQAAQDCIQVGLEYIPRSRLHNPFGQPTPVLKSHVPKNFLPFPILSSGLIQVLHLLSISHLQWRGYWNKFETKLPPQIYFI